MKEQHPEHLYELLPVIYRQLDIEQDESLRALMDVIESVYRVLETDLDQLYNNWFIETCDPWVVPYIGDLLGIRGIDSARDLTASERSRVANTIAYRRRKGILTTLERAIQDATGWKTHVVEFFKQLSITQSLPGAQFNRGLTADLRDWKSASESGTPFNSLAHTIDVRSLAGDPLAESEYGENLHESASLQGKFNLGNVGIFLWRLQSYPVRRGTPRQLQPNCYSFSPLGVAWQSEGIELFPLFNQPLTEVSFHQVTRERNVPGVLSRSTLASDLASRQTATSYFGSQPVLEVFARRDASAPFFESIAAENMVVRNLRSCRGSLFVLFSLDLKYADDLEAGPIQREVRREFAEHGISLSPAAQVAIQTAFEKWLITAGAGAEKKYLVINEGSKLDVYDASIRVAVDPQLGRLAFPPHETPAELRVSYSYGFSMDIGGGPYDRRQALAHREPNTWRGEPNAWRGVVSTDHATIPQGGQDTPVFATLNEALRHWANSGRSGIIQIADNGIYQLGTTDQMGALPGFESVTIGNGQSLVIEAANGVAPCLLGGLSLMGHNSGARVRLSGLLLEGTVLIGGQLELDIQHCTLRPARQRLTEIKLLRGFASPVTLAVNIEDSLVGRICLPGDTCSLSVHRSIVDGSPAATAISGVSEEAEGCVITARAAPGEFGPQTTLARSTIFGRVVVKELGGAADVIFRDQVRVQNQHTGSMRYSYVPPGSQTPERYRCQPDLTLQEAENANEPAHAGGPVRPSFTAEVFGHPAYAQLGLQCPREIQAGAENGSEMGVFNQLYQPRRRAELGLALAEYLPFGQQAGVFYVN